MPRVSRYQAALNRAAIRSKAARLYRERGFDGVGIPEITQAAGLTHGSFYGHFASKDELTAEALKAAFEAGFERWEARREGKPTIAAERAGFIDGYLTARNRDNPGDACPIAALAGDVSRLPTDSVARQAFLAGVKVICDKLVSVQEGDQPGTVEQKALTDLATLAGALVLSRATAGSELSDKFLALVSAELTGRKATGFDPPKN